MKILLLFVLCVSCVFSGRTQTLVMSVGSSKTMTIKSGTVFGADSLVLTPSSDFTLTSTNITESPIAVAGTPTSSINRVYYLSNQVNFSGTLQIYYKTSELNGNIESQLQFYDSTIGSYWFTEAGSTDNAASNYVQYSASNHLMVSASAAQTGTVLALSLLSFDGAWINDEVLLTWNVASSDADTKYEVTNSQDGQHWSELSEVDGVNSAGPVSFHQKDQDPNFSSRYYRVKATDAAGATVLSRIIRMDRATATNSMKIASKSRGAIFYFSGDKPAAVRVINMGGQILWQSRNPSSEYEVSDMIPGVYLVQYQIGNGVYSRKFLVQ
jgi:hypothetical protein